MLGDEVVDPLEEARLLQIRVRRQARKPAGALRPPARDHHEPPDEVDAGVGERVKVERHPGRVADELHRRVAARPLDVLDLVVALIELADRRQPAVDVAAAVGAREPDVLTDRNRYATS